MTHHPSFGSILSWDPAGGTSWAALGQVQDITGPSISRGSSEVTDHDSKVSASGFAEFLPEVADGGEVGFALGLDPKNTAHVGGTGTGLLGDFENDGCELAAFKCTLNVCGGTAIWTWDGFLTGYNPSTPVRGQHTADVTVKVSGKPTLTVT